MDDHNMIEVNLKDFSGRKRASVTQSVTASLNPDIVRQIQEMLIKGERHNVFVNKFDRNKPFRVSVSFDGMWNNYGNFNNIEVATCVGALAAAYWYGHAANTGVFDYALVQKHPEFILWATNNEEFLNEVNGK